MSYVFTFLMGLTAGGVCVFLALLEKRRRLKEQKSKQDAQEKKIQEALEERKSKQDAQGKKIQETLKAIKARRDELDRQRAELSMQQRQLEARIVSYSELEHENAIVKRDLRNIDVDLRKLQLDRELQRQAQETLDRRSNELATRYLKENTKWVGSSLTTSNFVASKQRLQKVMERCRAVGFEVAAQKEAALLVDLKEEYQKIVRVAFEREEQARIKAQIREEQRLEREIERELKQLEVERAAIQAALRKALAEAEDKHSEEIERLRARLTEAEQKAERAISRAQMTRSGHVYVISNIGSFGEGVFKIGMTRRLEPTDRIRELSGASVPFPFDVHMMLSSDDAPSLENALHRALHKLRINKTNPRKEFFETDIEAIRQIAEDNHGAVQYVADPEALEYRQTLAISDEDQEFIESVYEALDEENETVLDDE